MSATLSEIIGRAETLAQGRGLDASQSPVINGTMVAETIYPHAVRYCITKALASGDNILNVARNFAIVITSGTGTLPDAVLRQFLASESYIVGVAYASFLDYSDYVRKRMNGLCKYYSVNGDTFYYSGADATINLNAPSVPALNANPDVAVDLPAEMVDNVIVVIADVLTGAMPLSALIEERL